MPEMSAADVSRSSGDAVLRILAVVRSIPYGCVANYGQVAARAGLSGRARLVAWALKKVADDDPVPWHRVLRSDGRIAFPEGSSSHAEQLHLLQREQVKLMNGRVQRAQFAWREADLDAQLWRQDS